MATLIADVLTERSTRAPEACCLVDGAVRLTNAQVSARVDALARALLAAGVRRGDRVAQLSPPSADFWLGLLAVTSIGAIWQGLNPRYTKRELAGLIADTEPRLLLARAQFDGRDYAAELAALSGGAPVVPLGLSPMAPGDPFCARGAAVSDVELAAARAAVQPEDVAVIVHTSGTTGRPKGAMLSHRAIVGTALANLAWIGAGTGGRANALDCTICAAPTNHVGAIDNVCMTVFAAGGRIVFHPRVDLAALAVIAAQEQPTYLVASPTAFAMLMEQPGFDFAAAPLPYRLIVFGGAPTSAAVLREVARSGARLAGVYGQTETCGMITATDADASPEAMSSGFGRPIPGVEMRIGGTTAPAEVGEIQVRGVCTMTGYWNNPAATTEAFTEDGWLRTGDLGIAYPDGTFGYTGRLKEMFKSGGYNVYPAEIELVLGEHPDVAQAAVIPVPHDRFQEVGHCFVLPRPGRAPDAEDLSGFLKTRLANYKIPKTWTLLDELPVLGTGKIDRLALRAKLQAG